MKEESFSLPTTDNKKIYGIISYAEKKASRAVILAHGLTGWMCEHIEMVARDVFLEAGYDVIRFNFYGGGEKARVLHETTLKKHVADLHKVCNHFRNSYEKLFVCGHSYGGQTLLMTNPDAVAFAFWGSTLLPYASFWKTEAKRLENTPYYTFGWGTNSLINPDMYKEGVSMSEEDAKGYLDKIKTPSLVALAGNSEENEPRAILHDLLSCEKKLIEVKGADHIFCAGNTALTLAHATRDFFNQY